MTYKILLITALALVIGTTVFAQGPRGPRGERGEGPDRQGPSVEQILERFDTSGNGELDADELQAMFDARKERMEKVRSGEGRQGRGEGRQGRGRGGPRQGRGQK